MSLPMFVHMGLMLDRSGVADTMMRNFVKVFGGIKGGLGLTVIVIGSCWRPPPVSWVRRWCCWQCCSCPSCCMNNHNKALAWGVVAASGTLGILIPPSIMLVLMADQVSVSVGDLFMGTLTSGVTLGLRCMAFVVIVGFLRPDLTWCHRARPTLRS